MMGRKDQPLRIAVLSVHGCPVVRAGEKDSGGMNVYVLETAKELARRGAQVDVFTRRHDERDPVIIDLAPGARVVHLDAGPPGTDKTEVFHFLPEFREALLRFCRWDGSAYDLISSHYWLSGVVGARLSNDWGAPHVASYHTLAQVKRRARVGEVEPPERVESERLIAAAADRIVVWTEHERDSLVRLYGADPGRVAVIPPGVDSERFRPLDRRECRARLGLGENPVILYVGRLERLKGVDILLRAVASLEYPGEVAVLVVGGAANSSERRRLAALARTLRIADAVSFIGSVDQRRLPEYYSAADICVLPSYYESFGLAALEAAACGTPVVASRVGGLPAIVKDGETGYLVNWRCPGPFVDRLEVLLANRYVRESMGRRARRRAEELTWQAAGAQLTDLFESLVAARSAAAGPASAARRVLAAPRPPWRRQLSLVPGCACDRYES